MRPFRLLACAALVAALLAPPAASQSRRETGFTVLRLDASTRAAALAGAGALPGDDPTAVFYNPALLSPEMSGAAALSYANLVLDVGSGAAVYARDVAGVTGAVGVRFVSYGEFERSTGADAGDEGTFGASDVAVSASAAREVLPDLRVGGTVHALFSSVDDADASALAADLGVTVSVPDQALTLGASVHHAGLVLSSLGPTADRLPLDVRLTATKRLQYVPLTVSLAATDLQAIEGPSSGADSSFARRALDHLALGGELALGSALTVRAGYNGRRANELDAGGRLDLAGASLGAGLRLRRVSVDYAYVGWSRFGGLHQFGVRTRL